MTFVERHGIPPVGGGLSLAHILYVQHDRPDVHERTAAYVESMDYVTARLTGRITATQHSTFMYQLCDNRSLDPPAYDEELVRLAGVDATRLPPLVAIDTTVGTLRPDDRARSSRSPRPRRCTRARTTPPPRPWRPVPSRRAGPGSPSAPRVCSSTRSTPSASTSITRSSRCPRRTRDRYVVCAENGLGGKLLEHVLRELVYAVDELGDHRGGGPVRRARRHVPRHRARRGRGHVPPLARGRERAPERELDAGWIREHVARDQPARPGPGSCRRSRAQPAGAAFPRRSLHRQPGRRDRARRRGGALGARGARCSPTCSTGP